MRISTEDGGEFAENRTLTDVNRRYFGVDGRFSAVNPWKLKPGFINRVLVEVIFEASKCL